MPTAPMQQEGPDGGDHSMLPRVASPVYSETSTEGAVMRGFELMAYFRYRDGRVFLEDVANMLKGIVQLLIDHLWYEVVSLPAKERNMMLIKPCASRSASYAVRATHLRPTDEIAKLQRNQVSRKAEAMRKDAQWFVRVKLHLRCDGLVQMSIKSSPFSNAHKYKDDWMVMKYHKDVLRNNSTRPILCYLYHHVERMDEVLKCTLDNFDRQVEFEAPNDEENDTYFELLALFNSALLLKLTSILRSCVTMFFHTTYTSIDCDGHATYLKHLLGRIQNRSLSMRRQARTFDMQDIEEEPDTTFTHRAAKRPRYEDGYSDSGTFTYSPLEAARYYCLKRRDHFTTDMANFLENL